MLILPEQQVQMCQLNFEEKSYSGFVYMNRLFMMKNFQVGKDYKTAIQEIRILLNDNIDCMMLEHSDGYTVWHLAPEKAQMINSESQDNIPEIKGNLQAKVMQFRGISYLGQLYNWETPIKKAQQSLHQGYKVKLLMQLEGKKHISSFLGNQILDRLTEKLENLANIEDKPQLEGSQVSVILSPI